MKLEDLAGIHKLDAVDFDEEKIKDWADEYEDCSVCRFRLDGVVYVAMEDPDDGYRSHMRDLTVSDSSEMTNVFPAVEVLARYKEKSEDNYWTEECDILELIDTSTGKTILRVGTGNTDDYYPYFVASFDPTAMAINN